MDRRLYEAAIAGNVTLLLELLREDPISLDGVGLSEDNPLHIAAILGHLEFAREIVSRKPELVFVPNSHGFSPLHLAAAKGYVEIVKELLKIDSSVKNCVLGDKDGRISLLELMEANPEPSRIQTAQGETILHLSVKNDHFDVVKWVVEWTDDAEFLNMKDGNGNTALHLAAATKNIQAMNLLLSKKGVDVNSFNPNCFTSFDFLPQHSSDLGITNEMRETFEDESAMTAIYKQSHLLSPPGPQLRGCNRCRDMDYGLVGETWNAVAVVATLIATVTFGAGLNPPSSLQRSGYWFEIEDQYRFHLLRARGILSSVLNWQRFMVIDTIGLIASLSTVVLIMSKPAIRTSVLIKVVMFLMWISVSSLALVFSSLLSVDNPTTPFAAVPVIWLGLLYLWLLIQFVLWLFRKFGMLRMRKKALSTEEDVELGIEK